METPSEINWYELAQEWAANVRAHAGYFSWELDRSIAESGVLDDFQTSLKRTAALFFTQARHRGQGNDPPDCEAIDDAGRRIGIELTELVDPVSAAAARARSHYDWKDWRLTLIPYLDRRIRKKDKPKRVHGGPYSKYVLVIYTDEPWLELDHIRRTLAAHEFPPTSLISRAYLLMSYWPPEEVCPCIKLNIGP